MDREGVACRLLPMRRCPLMWPGGCGGRPCARLESDDPDPWLAELSMRMSPERVAEIFDVPVNLLRDPWRWPVRVLLAACVAAIVVAGVVVAVMGA